MRDSVPASFCIVLLMGWDFGMEIFAVGIPAATANFVWTEECIWIFLPAEKHLYDTIIHIYGDLWTVLLHTHIATRCGDVRTHAVHVSSYRTVSLISISYHQTNIN